MGMISTVKFKELNPGMNHLRAWSS